MSTSSETTLELLKVDEVAEILNISGPGVRRLLQKQLMPFYRVMGSVRIDKKDVLSYLEDNRSERVDSISSNI